MFYRNPVEHSTLKLYRKMLQAKDADARKERIIHKGGGLFKTENIIRKERYEERYNTLL